MKIESKRHRGRETQVANFLITKHLNILRADMKKKFQFHRYLINCVGWTFFFFLVPSLFLRLSLSISSTHFFIPLFFSLRFVLYVTLFHTHNGHDASTQINNSKLIFLLSFNNAKRCIFSTFSSQYCIQIDICFVLFLNPIASSLFKYFLSFRFVSFSLSMAFMQCAYYFWFFSLFSNFHHSAFTCFVLC